MGNKWVLVGSGVYLADAPKAAEAGERMSASELMTLVREGAAVLEKKGEKAYPEFRQKGSKWFRDDTYFFVWTMDGTRVFHAADPAIEGRDASGVKDVLGRPYGKMFLDAAAGPAGEGWVRYCVSRAGGHLPYMEVHVCEAGDFSFRERVHHRYRSDMQMDKAFVEDVVNRVAALVADQGKEAFSQFRDKTGPFVFMDTYVFVDTPGRHRAGESRPAQPGRKEPH